MTAGESTSPLPVTSSSRSWSRGAMAPAMLLVFSLILLGISEWQAPGFASSKNILQLLKLASFLGLAAVGQTIVMLTGGIDLSIAWVLTGSALVFTHVCDGQNANIVPAAAAALSVGLVSGLINGFGIVKLRISPIIMTLGMNNILLGASLVYTGGTPSGSPGSLVRALATESVGLIPAMVILWCVIAAIVIAATRFTRSGRMLLSVGENARVSFLTGLPNDRVIISAYAFCGLMTAATGILFSAFSGTSFLGMGDQFVLPTVAAVVLGGTSIFGGRGGYGGTMAAVIFTTILSTALVIDNISPGVRSIVFGLVILAAVLAQRFLTRRDERDS